MDNPFTIRFEANRSTNFLIYLQNGYLNQQGAGSTLFPYHPVQLLFTDSDTFQTAFEKKWADVTARIAGDPEQDRLMFHEEPHFFYESLFMDTEDGNKQFNGIRQSFTHWWDSFAGRFAIERSIDERSHKLYKILSENAPGGQLEISLIYDRIVFGREVLQPNFATVPISDFYLKKDELVEKLKRCIK